MDSKSFSAAAVLFLAASAVVFAQQGQSRPGQNGRGRGDAAPEIAIADIPYTNNIVDNAGFEKGLDKDPRKGWMDRAGEGAEAKIVSAPQNAQPSDLPPEGRKALKLSVKKPGKYSGKQLNGDWSTFSAVPAVYAGVMQLVKVKPGTPYAMRYRWRGVDFYETETAAGPGRGQMTASVGVQWLDSNMRPIARDKMEPAQWSFQEALVKTSASTMKGGSAEWKTFAYPAIPTPEEVIAKKKNIPNFPTAPKGAAYARIVIGLSSKNPKAKPELWIDQVEFSEVPPVPVPLPQAPAAAPAAK